MRLPAAEPGLVFRYDFHWSREARKGRSTSKDRPACLVATIDDEADPLFVVIFPITHAAPSADVVAVELPPKVRAALGLDKEPCWVIVSEYNVDEWPPAGMNRAGQGFAYGFLPDALFGVIKKRFADTVRRGRARGVQR
jgi:hypothetical protein